MCLAQGHKAVTPVRLEPAAHQSGVKHSTTEPLRSLYIIHVYIYDVAILRLPRLQGNRLTTMLSLCLLLLLFPITTGLPPDAAMALPPELPPSVPVGPAHGPGHGPKHRPGKFSKETTSHLTRSSLSRVKLVYVAKQ